MKIPNKIYLCGRDVKVIECPESKMNGNDGSFDIAKDTILIRKNLTPQNKLATLIHEVMEFVCTDYGVRMIGRHEFCFIMRHGELDLLSREVASAARQIYSRKK